MHPLHSLVPPAATAPAPAAAASVTPPTATSRRVALSALRSLGVATLWGCGGGGESTSTDAGTGTDSGSGTGSGTGSGSSSGTGTGTGTGTTTTCSVVPEETAGPYPADGSTASNNTYNVLALSGIVRSDIIRSSVGSSSQVGGVPLSITITLTNTKASCAPLSGYAIYLWHCTQDGNYSVYSSNNIADNYLRGVQATDANGTVTFTTIVPGC